jgi:hypothetical protein
VSTGQCCLSDPGSPDTSTTRFRSDYRAGGELFTVPRKNPETGSRLSAGAKANEPENSRVKHAVERSKLAKVLVQRDEDVSLT